MQLDYLYFTGSFFPFLGGGGNGLERERGLFIVRYANLIRIRVLNGISKDFVLSLSMDLLGSWLLKPDNLFSAAN